MVNGVRLGTNIRYFDWLEMVWTEELSPESKLICAYLARFMNKDKDIAWPSQARIMHETGLKKATLNRRLNEIESKGFIIRNSGVGKNTQYIAALPSSLTQRLVKGVNPSHTETQLVSQGDQVVSQGDTNISINKSSNISRRFTPPTLQEVSKYCQERNNAVDPEKFIAHYEASGWMRSKTKIKDWKACVRTWERNNKNSQPEDFTDVLDRSL